MSDPPPTLAQLGERYRHARTIAGLTQTDVAAAAGLTRSSIANFEAGRQDMPISKIIALCLVAHVDLARLWEEPHPCPTCGCAWSGTTGTS